MGCRGSWLAVYYIYTYILTYLRGYSIIASPRTLVVIFMSNGPNNLPYLSLEEAGVRRG